MPTKIEWTEETWNPVTGCTKISAGCKNCYAERMARRLAGRYGYPKAPDHFDVTLRPDRLDEPLKWRKPRRVFVCSMGDLFHDDVPLEFIGDVFQVMSNAKHHTFQVLTKRPARMLEFYRGCGYGWIDWDVTPNIWLGVTAENQRQANERIPILLETPAAKRFVSIEPMLGAVDLDFPSDTCHCGDFADHSPWEGHHPVPMIDTYLRYLDWVICGAETGPSKRPMELDWARSLRDQCQAAGVPFFFKKDSDGNREFGGRLWEEMPE